MSIEEKLDEIQARATSSAELVRDYINTGGEAYEIVLADRINQRSHPEVESLVVALRDVLKIDTGDNRAIYGVDFEAGMVKALWLVRQTIINRVCPEEDES